MFVAEETCLSLALSETLKTDFVASRPNPKSYKSNWNIFLSLITKINF